MKEGVTKGLLALSPVAVFLCLYLIVSVAAHDFYAMPLTVAFVAASIYAIIITRGIPLKKRIDIFSSGAGNSNIILMVWIFVLAGAFAASATELGSIDATVTLVVRYLPDNLLPAGLFAGACFISLAIGTSVGTIVALVPMVSGIAELTGSSPAFMAAIVTGGAFFGDNLSFISDTTIAATRTQGCNMADKFRANLRIVLPAAVIVFVVYIVCGLSLKPVAIEDLPSAGWVKIIPYIVVLATAIAGVNVQTVLITGILTTGVTGALTGDLPPLQWVSAMGKGMTGMGELIIITLLAGGMLEMIRYNGGVDFILHILSRGIRNKRGAEMSIAALVSIANVCTANNTIAIITVGPLAADIARRYGVPPQRSASIIDTFSCVVQGMLPYGAQLLMAATLASLSPLDIISYLYYPFAVAVCAIAIIMLRTK